jgi:hypothetical protein
MKKERGSTRADALAAIIAVMMIITTAMAAIVPAMNKAKSAALRATCAEQMKQVAMGLSAYADEYNGLPWYGGVDPVYPAPWNESPAQDTERHPYVVLRANPDKTDWLEGRRPSGRPVPMRLGCLYRSGIITNARVFYCPANVDSFYRYESYVNPAPPNTSYDWLTIPQQINQGSMNEWVRVGYIYYPISTTAARDAWNVPIVTARKFNQLDYQKPFMTDRIWNSSSKPPEPGTGYFVSGMDDLSHKEENIYAFNAVFKDGHVVFVKGQKTLGQDPVTQQYLGVFNEGLWSGFALSRWDSAQGQMISGDSYRYFYYSIFSQVQP